MRELELADLLDSRSGLLYRNEEEEYDEIHSINGVVRDTEKSNISEERKRRAKDNRESYNKFIQGRKFSTTNRSPGVDYGSVL